jgi:putative phage-type endonuclease
MLESNRAAWLEERRAGIGGSDAAAVVSLHPWKSPLQLYLEKRGELPQSEEETEAMFWGKALEEPIARRYCEVTGRKVRRQPIRKSGKHPWMLANIDRQIIGEPRGPGVYEGKTSNPWTKIDGLEGLPDHYYLQLQHYLAVTGYEWGSCGILIGGQRFLWFDVERDQSTIGVLVEAEREFWRRVELGDPPPADGSDATREMLKLLYPQDSGGSVILDDPEAYHEATSLVNVRDVLRQHEAIKQEYENRLKVRMGDAAEAVIPGFGKISWKSSKESRRFDSDALREYEPATYERFLKVVPGTRRFLVSPMKEGK